MTLRLTDHSDVAQLLEDSHAARQDLRLPVAYALQLLDALIEADRTKRRPPSLRELTEMTGYPKQTVVNLRRCLEIADIIEVEPLARGIYLNHDRLRELGYIDEE